jgi:heterotetrameric sarcosine oxidase gamma subunit
MNPSATIPNGSSALQQAGIERQDLTIGAVRLREVTNLALARLRMGESARAAEKLTAELPDRTGQCTGSDPVFLCLGPREWLVISATSTPVQLMDSMQSAIGAGFAAAYDLTPGLAVLRLSGDAAPWLLSKLSSLDFVGGIAAGPHCARTRMGDAAVTVHYHRPANAEWSFDLFAERSLADYLWRLLLACAPHANELANTPGDAR